MSKDFNPHEAIDFLFKHAKEYAQAKANRVYLEQFRKTKKAILMNDCDKKTGVDKEAFAYAHPEYQEVIQGLRVAVENETTLQWKLIAAQARIDVWRSEEASNRGLDKRAA